MKIKKILISQPEPVDLEKSPYRNLVHKLGVNLTFYKFFEVVGISSSDFRKTRIHLHDHTAVIFNSKNSIDHFFRMMKELREPIGEEMKYFCSTEAIALYLQNYIDAAKSMDFWATSRRRVRLPQIWLMSVITGTSSRRFSSMGSSHMG